MNGPDRYPRVARMLAERAELMRRAALAAIAPGPGQHQAFMCGRCAKPKQQMGRRKRLLRGAKVWVCVGCAIGGAS